MPRSAIIFLVAVFLPSLVLGGLALHAAGKQRILIERQAADLHQAEADGITVAVREAVEGKQRVFSEAVRSLVPGRGTSALAENFGPLLSGPWPDGGIPFAISPQGGLAYPTSGQARRERQVEEFLTDNGAFLSNNVTEEIYQTQQAMPSQAEATKQAQSLSSISPQAAKAEAPAEKKLRRKSDPAPTRDKSSEDKLDASAGLAKQKTHSKEYAQISQMARNIVPQNRSPDANEPVASKLNPALSDFQSAVANSAQGVLARFVQNELQVLIWTKPDPASGWLFGIVLGPADLARLVREIGLQSPGKDTVLAILDDRARPVFTSPTGAAPDWKHPFVATEIGEMLPHWEVALYLANPGQLTDSARLVTVTLTLLIATALAAILGGS